MMSNREIITLQFGNYTNYVGTHWWNIQESGFSYSTSAPPSDINHDVLYREGVDYKGNVTYTPRLLLVDLKGSLKHCSQNGLYDHATSSDLNTIQNSIPWESNDVEVMKEKSIPKPKYQQDLDQPSIDPDYDYHLESTVETWTDFTFSRFHPRSITIVNEYDHSSTEDSFDCFTAGVELWKGEQFENDFCDRIRQYIEECNNCQGFQTLFDCTNGFSGLAIKCIDHMDDEYSKCNFAVPLFSPKSLNFRNVGAAMSNSIRVINIVMSFANMIEQSSLIVPLSTMSRCWRQTDNQRSFPYLSYDQHNFYQTSSILATYLDTISMKYRLKDQSKVCLLSGFCSDLHNYGRKLVGAGLAFPLKLGADQDFIDCLDQQDGPLFTQLTPNTNIGTNHVVQSVFVRGIPQSKLKRPLKSANHQIKMAAYQCDSVAEMLQLYFQCNNYASMSHVSNIESGLQIKTPFPIDMFDKRVQTNGFIEDFERMERNDIFNIPVLALAQVSSQLADTIESLHREAKRIKIAKLHRFKDTGLEEDELSEVLENLLSFKDNYEDNLEL